ncbi:MAG: glycosyltransferase family 39 protein [Alphaproteobacteria bacterium]|nr:glycosyltransferase family 39 protein [Alphaproteobacteria bacterium]
MAETETGTEDAAPARPKGRLLNFLARHPLPLLTLFCLLLWLPGIFSLPALDRDESRFAQSSRQMLESGNFVDIRLGHVPRYKKPVGIYWLQAATTAAAAPFVGTGQIWTYRLASLLGAVLAVWLTVWCAGAVLEAEGAFLAGALMAGTLLLGAEATIATTDAVLLACTLAVQGVLLRLYKATREGTAQPSTKLIFAGWLMLAAGALVKFPIVPGVALVTLVVLLGWDAWLARGKTDAPYPWRWLGSLKPLPGLALTLLLVSPWLIAIAVRSHGAFFHESLGNDFAAKLAGGQESHGAPPGYYLLLSAATFWPAILFVLSGVAAAIPRRNEAAIRFLLAWAGGWWLLVEAVPTKLPHYVIGAYPALAILAAAGIIAPVQSLWQKLAAWISGVLFLIGAAALVAALVLLPRLYGGGDVLWLWAPAGIGSVLALAALGLFAFSKRGWALALSLAAALTLFPALSAGAGPRLQQLWLTTRLAAAAIKDGRAGDPPPVLAGYEEPSMLFALGSDLGLSDGAGAADMVARDGGLALIEAREKGSFLARLAEKEADATVIETVSGFNYSRGQRTDVTIYRVAAVGH